MKKRRVELKPHDITKQRYWVHEDAYAWMLAESFSGRSIPVAIVHEDKECLTDNAHTPIERVVEVSRREMKRLVNGPAIVYRCLRCGGKK